MISYNTNVVIRIIKRSFFFFFFFCKKIFTLNKWLIRKNPMNFCYLKRRLLQSPKHESYYCCRLHPQKKVLWIFWNNHFRKISWFIKSKGYIIVSWCIWELAKSVSSNMWTRLCSFFYCTRQAARRNTKAWLDLLTDIDMLLIVGKGIRGRICQSIYW